MNKGEKAQCPHFLPLNLGLKSVWPSIQGPLTDYSI